MCRGLGTGMPLESWFMLQDFSKMPLYTLLAGLKIMLLVSVRPTHSGEPRETSAVTGESPLEESSRESSSLDIFREDNVWYISRLEGGDCFLPMEEFKESHSEAVSCTSLKKTKGECLDQDVHKSNSEHSSQINFHSLLIQLLKEICYTYM